MATSVSTEVRKVMKKTPGSWGQAGSCGGELPLKRNSSVYCPAAVSIGLMLAIYHQNYLEPNQCLGAADGTYLRRLSHHLTIWEWGKIQNKTLVTLHNTDFPF